MFRKIAVAMALSLAASARVSLAQKALVYCPVGVDAGGCDRIVAALQSRFPDGVDRGYDGGNGTVDLRTIDLQHYGVVVVPSLADDDSLQPYRLLRSVAARLHFAINGRVAVYSGAPDQGSANRADKDAIIQNLATWAAGGHTRATSLVGLVAFLDLSAKTSDRYSWVRAVSLADVSADAEVQSIGDVTTAGRGAELLKSGGRAIAFANMAANGLHIGLRSAGRTEVGALGGATNRQSVLVTYSNADGRGAGTSTNGSMKSITAGTSGASFDVSGSGGSGPTLITDKPDYLPGDTVLFTGAGWAPNDTVTITIHEDPQWSNPDRTVSSVVDANGNLSSHTFVVDQRDYGVTFTATAVGNPSGLVAQTTFTDGNSTVSGTVTDAVTHAAISGATVACAITGINPCNNALSTTTNASGAYTMTVQFSGSSNTIRLTASATGYTNGVADVTVSNSLNPTQNFALTPAGPTKLAFVPPALSGTVNQCLGPITVQTQNAASTPTNVTSATTVNLATDNGTSGTGAFYATNLCASPITSVNIATGNNSAQFFYDASARGSGSHKLTASASGLTSDSQTETIDKANQTIAFAALANKTFGDADFTVSATATSGLPVTFTVGATDQCTISVATVHLTGAGSCTVKADQAGDGNYNAAPQVSQTFTINKADQTITFAALATKTFGDADFTVSATATSGLTVTFTVGATDQCTITIATVHLTGAGSCTVKADQAGDGNYNAAPQVSRTFTIGKATPVVSATGGTFPFDGNPHAGSGTATGVGGANLTPVTLSYAGTLPTTYGPTATAPTNAGTYTVTASYATDANYLAASSTPAALTITKVDATISATGFSGPYDGSPHPGSCSATGVGNVSVPAVSTYAPGGSTTPVNAGSYTLTCAVSGQQNYNDASVDKNITITKVELQVKAEDKMKTYDGNVFSPFTSTITGFVNGENSGVVSGAATYTGSATTAVNAGTYVITPVVTGLSATNYSFAPANGSLLIKQAPLTIKAEDKEKTYDGDPFTAFTVTYTGLIAADANPGPQPKAGVLSTPVTFTGTAVGALNAGSYTITPTGATAQNYEITFTGGTLKIDKADPTISVTGFSGKYDGDAHGATGSAKGVKNETLAGLSLGASFTNVPGGTANWTFTDVTGNYNNASGSVAITITKADPIINVSGYSGVYDGNAHGASGDAKGVKNEVLAGLVLGASFTNVPGGTANWAFTDVTGNYNNKSGSVSITITPATPTIQWSNPADVQQGTALSGTQLNATVQGVSNTDITSHGTLGYTPASGTVLVNVGPNTLSASFTSSDANYTNAGPKTVSINVINVPPTVAAIVAPTDPVAITSAVNISTSFTDPGGAADNPYSVKIDWGKDPISGLPLTPTTFTMTAPGSISQGHTYAAAGIYIITVTVTDKNGGVGSNSTTNYVVVYDPSGGFVTGGGWINSPAGACQLTAACGTATGHANFGFVSKYQKGANVPDGNTEFQFQAGGLNFKSTAYQWLVISGARAQFKGTGTINGSGSYGFLLTAIDGSINGGGGTDRFRIKIWDLSNPDVALYDNQMGSTDDSGLTTPGTLLGGGSISIKSK